MNNRLVAAMILSLRNLGLEKVCAAYNALTGFGNISQLNIAYEDLLDRDLIDKSGKPTASPELEQALQFVINESL